MAEIVVGEILFLSGVVCGVLLAGVPFYFYRKRMLELLSFGADSATERKA